MKTLTTGEIAKMCDVNLRTVIRWIDRGDLKGFKLPGRGNNRVQIEDFVHFLNEHGMPIPPELVGEGNRRILIIDDEAAVARSIGRVLRTAGYDTTIATDGFQGGSLLMKQQPALVTLDLRMPGISGYDVLKFIRTTPETAATKVIVISALDQLSLQRALDEGADAVLAKPFDNQQLMNLVKKMVPLASEHVTHSVE
ncbi:response regulator [Marinobacterium sediminicola]|uniref:Helix-turn-helix domain-containing protein n=1 Tax=Marinobacterium sediminicola TaxID=518898 RepID=A0ABY1RYV7_9GAMM|nr:response regulator [Marinobacterium sediminicola]ULG67997.1 response regulator [Marinobacterium sediminicola]SMR73493.1 Helix-turn-helix domain-containing protein [Marinobacterium sediminicola]